MHKRVKLPEILVLMSTYNGERFLAKQLDSILMQEGVSVCILVRDDGSIDNTREILRDYENRYRQITVILGKNRGWAESFQVLLREAFEKYSLRFCYFAFSDQDDVWKKNKLHAAVTMLDSRYHKNLPVLYIGNAEMVRSDLTRIGYINPCSPEELSPTQYLVAGYCLGCTMCFNKELLSAYCASVKTSFPSHDRCLALLAKYLGNVIYDKQSYIAYRQHGSNACGWRDLRHASLKNRIVEQKKYKGLYTLHAKMMYEVLGHKRIGEGELKPLELFAKTQNSLCARCRVFCSWFSLGFGRHEFLFDTKNRIKILLGWL